MSQASLRSAAPRRTESVTRTAGGRVYALLLDRKGGGREISWQQVRAWTPDEGILWLVGHPAGEETQRWLRLEQYQSHKGQGLFLSLRGGGLGQEPQPELQCANLWADANRLIVLRPAAVQAFSAIRADLKNRQGPTSMGELLAEVIYAWILRIEQILHGIDRDVDDMEDHILMDPDADLQQDLTALRQRMIHLGRHLTPQAAAGPFPLAESRASRSPARGIQSHPPVRCRAGLNP